MRLLMFLFAAFFVAPEAAAFDRDFHYAWTYWLALEVGYTERQALQIASAAQSVDDVPHTDPLAGAAAWDLAVGGDSPLANPNVGMTWRDFHCFVERALEDEEAVARRRRELGEAASALEWWGVAANTDGAVARARGARDARLRDLARTEGNPGPLLHYQQDCFSHFDFNERIGHASVGHAPDWIATHLERSWQATLKTLDTLAWFRRDVMGEDARAPDLGRVREVLGRLIDVNPRSALGLAPTLEAQLRDPGQTVHARWDTFWGPVLGTLAVKATGDATWGRLIDTGNPDVGAAIRVIQAAVEEERLAGRLAWDRPGAAGPSPPLRSMVYDYNSLASAFPAQEGSTVGSGSLRAALERTRDFVVEQPRLTVGAPVVAVERDPRSEALFRVDVTLSYRLEHTARLPDALPVRETCAWSDAAGLASAGERSRGDGVHVVASTAYRTASALDGGLTRRCTIEAYGIAPVVLEARVPAVVGPPEPPVEGVDAWLVAASERVAGLRSAALAAAAFQESACASARAEVDGAVARLDALEPTLAEAEVGVARARGAERLLPGARDRADALLADVRAAAERVALANDALRGHGLGACRAAERAASAREEEREGLLRSAAREVARAASRRDEIVAAAARARVDADALAALAREIAATTVHLDAARGLDVARPGRVALAAAARPTAEIRALRNRAVADVAEARAAWGDRIPRTRENTAAFGALFVAWRDLDATASAAGACVGPIRADLDATDARVDALVARADAQREAADALARSLPSPDVTLYLDARAADAEATASAAEIFVDAAVALAADAAACIASEPSAPSLAPAPEPRAVAPRPPPPTPGCRWRVGPDDVLGCWCSTDGPTRRGEPSECPPRPGVAPALTGASPCRLATHTFFDLVPLDEPVCMCTIIDADGIREEASDRARCD